MVFLIIIPITKQITNPIRNSCTNGCSPNFVSSSHIFYPPFIVMFIVWVVVVWVSLVYAVTILSTSCASVQSLFFASSFSFSFVSGDVLNVMTSVCLLLSSMLSIPPVFNVYIFA